jgi:predicted RNase H-like HicB family nuclease
MNYVTAARPLTRRGRRRTIPFMNSQTFNAVIRRDEGWWIGWVQEIPGVNSQGKTRAELLKNLRSALREAIEMNREEARNQAGQDYEEALLKV